LEPLFLGGTMKRTSRKPSNLSESLHRQLNSYALGASAAGVGVLALASPSEAKIVYTPTHKVLHGSNPAKSLPLDLNNDGTVDFRIFDLWFVDTDFGPTGWLSILPSHSPNGVEGHTVNFGTIYVSVLAGGLRSGRRHDSFPTLFLAPQCATRLITLIRPSGVAFRTTTSV